MSKWPVILVLMLDSRYLIPCTHYLFFCFQLHALYSSLFALCSLLVYALSGCDSLSAKLVARSLKLAACSC